MRTASRISPFFFWGGGAFGITMSRTALISHKSAIVFQLSTFPTSRRLPLPTKQGVFGKIWFESSSEKYFFSAGGTLLVVEETSAEERLHLCPKSTWLVVFQQSPLPSCFGVCLCVSSATCRRLPTLVGGFMEGRWIVPRVVSIGRNSES